MRKNQILVLVVLISVLFAACTNNSFKDYENIEAMITDTKNSVSFISADEFKNLMESKSNFYLIDCREESEFEIACIKGADNVPRGLIEFNIGEKAPKRRTTVVIYCNNGERSTLAASILPKLKYSDVKVIEGGFEAWAVKYPKLVEENPIRGNIQTTAPKKPSGGCGG
jgi:rhodanese-related sulfurtransferase